MIVDNKEIIKFIEEHGPSLPSEIKTKVNIELIYLSAVLSELVRNNTLKMTSLKIGGSPLYYLPNQENKIERLYNYLKAPEKEVFQKLKSNKVLRDDDLSPVEYVAIRKITDFAKPIKITTKDHSETFWKWHLTTNAEIKEIIQQKLSNSKVNEAKETENKKQNGFILRRDVVNDKKEEEEYSKEKNKKQDYIKDVLEKPEYNQFQKADIPDNSNVFSQLKINKNFVMSSSELLRISLQELLLNTSSYAILRGKIDFIPICVGFHDKKTLSINDLMLFYGYAKSYNLQPILIVKESSIKKVEHLKNRLNIKIYSARFNRFLW